MGNHVWEQYPLELNVAECCEILNVSRPTLSKWLNTGKIPARKIESTWFIDRDNLRAFLKGES